MSHTVAETVEYIPNATIDTVEDAIYNALHRLVGTVVGCVERSASIKGSPTTEELLAIIGNKSPALILMQDRAPIIDTIETLALGAVEKRMQVEWIVMLVVVETRTPGKALKGTGTVSGVKGVYKLQAAVTAALNGLEVPGMWYDSDIEAIGHQWVITEPGKLYANAMRFLTDLVIEPVEPTIVATDMDGIDIEINVPQSENDTVSSQTLMNSVTVDTRP